MEDSEGINILLVDDEEDIREVLSIVLTDRGYNVTSAENAMAALSMLEKYTPRIIITDIKMPLMNGLELLEKVKERWPDIEVIVVTAFGEMEYAVKALQLNASDFITKPVDESALMIAVKRAEQRFKTRKELRDYTNFLEKENLKTANELLNNYIFQKKLIDNAIDGIAGVDYENKIVTFNKSLSEILKYKESDVIGTRNFSELFSDSDYRDFTEKFLGNDYGGEKKLFLYGTSLIDRDGNQVPVQISAYESVNGSLVCFIRDLRQVRKLERELSDQANILHQDKMMSLGRLAASVVHEVNNPLFGVLNYIKLMIRILKREDPDGQQKEKFIQYLDLVEKEIGRCSGIISGLLAFSRKSEPKFSSVDISELMGKCILLSRHKLELSNIELFYEEKKDIPKINGDFNQLQQCLINLVFNAIDAIDKNGMIKLETGFKPKEKEVFISVKDNGAGIEEKHLKRIFEPFFTTKKEGSGVGLGLSTVHGIIEHHKGKIDVVSSVGKGSTFTIHLPV